MANTTQIDPRNRFAPRWLPLLAGSGAMPAASVLRFRNRLRSMRDRWHAGTIDPAAIGVRIRAWIAHAEHAQTWRLRRTIFHGGLFDPSWQPGYPPAPRPARRFLEQQPMERPLWVPEQEQRPEHEYRLPVGQHASMPELVEPRFR